MTKTITTIIDTMTANYDNAFRLQATQAPNERSSIELYLTQSSQDRFAHTQELFDLAGSAIPDLLVCSHARRDTSASDLYSICDKLESLFYSRIRASFGLDIITYDNYQSYPIDTWCTSISFLRFNQIQLVDRPTTLADILDAVHTEKIRVGNYSATQQNFFRIITQRVGNHDFKTAINLPVHVSA